MASAAPLPVIGVAGIGLARAVTATIGEGLSFAAELARGSKSEVQPDQAEQQREQRCSAASKPWQRASSSNWPKRGSTFRSRTR
jgi:hypothetical protein